MAIPLFDRMARIGPAGTVVGTGLVTALVGVFDVVSGTDVRVLSLYLLPVAWCSWRLGRRGAVGSAGLALATWGLAQWLSGVGHWSAAVWGFNLLSQGVALLAPGALVAELARRLAAETAAGRLDTLTGLRNRRGLALDSAPVLAMCQRHARPVALAFVDLDDFKQVNDRLGHARGDAVLRACADALAHGCRSTDVAARLGGDEFVVLMPETTGEQARDVMQRVRQAFVLSDATRQTGVDMTVGVLAESPSERTLDALLAEADALMYEAKRQGKGRVFAPAAAPAPIIGPLPAEPT